MSAIPKLRFKEFKDSWVELKVKDFAETKTGSRDTQNRIAGGLYPFFVRSDTIERINTYDFDGEAILTSGDGVGVGKNFHYIDGRFDYHQRVYAIRKFSNKVSGKFFFQFFKEHFYKRVMRLSAKNSVDSVRMSMITDMTMPCPTLPEQKKIADFLRAVDEKIAGLRERELLLTQYKKGVMQKIFTQTLRFKADDGSDFPEWQSNTIGGIYDWVKTNSLSRANLNYESGEVKNIHYGDIHTKFSKNFKQEEEDVPFITSSSKSDFLDTEFCQLGDVIFADASEDYDDIGKAIEIVKLGKFPLVAGLHTYIARPKQGAVAIGFSAYLFQSWGLRYEIMRIAQGISVLGISKTNLERITFQMPHLDEQQKIAEFLSAIDAKITAVSTQISQMQDFKKGLLQQMFV